MFYVVTLHRQVDVEPRLFGPNLKKAIEDKVIQEAQGTVDQTVGYIIAVSQVNLLGKGLIRSDGSGLATFNVEYKCVTLRLWADEVVDAEVMDTNRYGFRCTVGPYKIFVSEKSMPDEFQLKHVNGQDLWVNDQDQEGIEIRELSQIGVATMKGHYLGVINM